MLKTEQATTTSAPTTTPTARTRSLRRRRQTERPRPRGRRRGRAADGRASRSKLVAAPPTIARSRPGRRALGEDRRRRRRPGSTRPRMTTIAATTPRPSTSAARQRSAATSTAATSSTTERTRTATSPAGEDGRLAGRRCDDAWASAMLSLWYTTSCPKSSGRSRPGACSSSAICSAGSPSAGELGELEAGSSPMSWSG